MKTQTTSFPPSPHLYSTSVVFRWQPCLFILQLLRFCHVCRTTRRVIFLSPLHPPSLQPRVLVSWDLNPSVTMYIFSPPCSFSSSLHSRGHFSIYDTYPGFISFSCINYRYPTFFLLNRCIVPHPRPHITPLSFSPSFFFMFLGCINDIHTGTRVTVLWFFF